MFVPVSVLILFSVAAQIEPAGQYSFTAKRPYTEVDKGEEEPQLNSKQRKFLKFQKRFPRKSC